MVDRRYSPDVQVDANHEHRDGNRLRQRRIPAHRRQEQSVQNYPRTTRQAGDSIWSRPAIRVFATYAKWDEKWGYDYTGSSSTNPYYGKAVSADFNGGSFGRGDSDEWTFGAQMEIWW